MTHLTMTYEYYYALGKAFAREKAPDIATTEINAHVAKCPAYLAQAFRDGANDQMHDWPN